MKCYLIYTCSFFVWWHYYANDVGWLGVGWRRKISCYLFCLLLWKKDKSDFNHHVLKIYYTEWVTIDVLFQSLLGSCKNLYSNFNIYWLNLEWTVLQNYFCLLKIYSLFYSPQTAYYLRNSTWLVHLRLLFELPFCTVIATERFVNYWHLCCSVAG